MLSVRAVKNEQDYQQVLAIRRAVFVGEQGVPESAEISTDDRDAHYFLAFDADKPVATGRFRVVYPFLKFERIATLREYRGRGIGGALMTEMHRAAGAFPVHLPLMYAQLSAVTFYRNIGWKEVGPEFIEAEILHVKMILPPKADAIPNLACYDDDDLKADVPPEIRCYLESALNAPNGAGP